MARKSTAGEAWELMFALFARYRPYMLSVHAEYGLKPPFVFVLQELDEPKPMGRIAQVLGVDGSNVTWLTDRLEERGLVERRPDPNDRRVKLLHLTDEGRKVRDEVMARLAVPPPELAELPERDARALREILTRALGD
jgi:DNA-binding MarR family transcriptional regulator